MVLVYSSIYAKITNDGLGEFLDDFDLDLSNLVNEIDLPGLDFGDMLLEQNEEIKEKEFHSVFEVSIECKDEEEQEQVYNKIKEQGYKCRLLTL